MQIEFSLTRHPCDKDGLSLCHRKYSVGMGLHRRSIAFYIDVPPKADDDSALESVTYHVDFFYRKLQIHARKYPNYYIDLYY